MKIKINGQNYEQLKFKGRILRNLLEIQDRLTEQAANDSFTTKDLDVMCEFLVDTFDNQFTSDDLLDNLEFAEIVEYFRQIASEIMKKTNTKMEKLAKK